MRALKRETHSPSFLSLTNVTMNNSLFVQITKSIQNLANINNTQLFRQGSVTLNQRRQRATVNISKKEKWNQFFFLFFVLLLLQDEMQMSDGFNDVSKLGNVWVVESLHELTLCQHALLLCLPTNLLFADALHLHQTNCKSAKKNWSNSRSQFQFTKKILSLFCYRNKIASFRVESLVHHRKRSLAQLFADFVRTDLRSRGNFCHKEKE